MAGNVHVSVQWRNNSIFAGELVDCTITFANNSHSALRRSPSPHSQRKTSNRDRWKNSLPHQPAKPAAKSGHHKPPSVASPNQAFSGSHKSSFSAGHINGRSKSHSAVDDDSTSLPLKGTGNNSHRRSVSIVSLGSEMQEEIKVQAVPFRPRSTQTHARAASLQVIPRRNGMASPAESLVPGHDRSFTVPSPLNRSMSSFSGQSRHQVYADRPLLNTTKPSASPRIPKTSQDGPKTFQFPASATPEGEGSSVRTANPDSRSSIPLRRALSPSSAHFPDHSSPITKVLSAGSINGTPRSSAEFYSMSNNSTETLASEYLAQEATHMLHRPMHNRQLSSLAPIRMPKPEILMMGYVQISGSFVLDGSLVNQSPFEEVKRKGIVGGQAGGGLLRPESTKRDSGLLGSFGWGNLGETFGGLLGDSGLSTMKEGKKLISTKSIPILSAPQSILFVDLQLKPGEKRSFHFTYPLPKGIPPSHRGKAMRTNYSLVIGTQRAAHVAQQNPVKRIEVPFRVLPCINLQGDVLGHDLMSPHILLSNSASVTSVEGPALPDAKSHGDPVKTSSKSSDGDFATYVERLLDRPDHSANGGLMSPTEEDSRSFAPTIDQPANMKEAIDLAILKCNTSNASRKGVNRFEITRSGQRVAVIMLLRPAYRLGESVPVVVDFHGADIPCYSLHATLETSESIDASLALRSTASVQRVTRRIHGSHTESTIASDRVFFSPMIPIGATPEFITTGVNLQWELRFEFVTDGSFGAETADASTEGLMEEVATDERGSLKAAMQTFSCETFDVAVPLRVYGAVPAFDGERSSDEYPV